MNFKQKSWDDVPYGPTLAHSCVNRPTVAEVNLDALLHNLAEVRRISLGTRILAVVKADAYGHGAVLVAKTLEEAGVDFFGVSLVEEGVELRRAGIGGDILVLGGAYSNYAEMVDNRLIPVVFLQEHLAGLQEAAQRAGQTARAHLEVDTGMNRIGLLPHELPALIGSLGQYPRVLLDGLLSHFANADCEDSSYTVMQMERYREAEQALRLAGHPVRWKHIANSAATFEQAKALQRQGFNMVRPGLALYGEYPAARLKNICDLQSLMCWKTSITHLKRLSPGVAVSYGGTWITSRESLIATLPVGYADGYHRQLSNRAAVLVRGRRAPIAGNVCMDMLMVDVTDVPEVAIHDEVVLLGRQKGARVTAQELAELCNTIPYEILCSVSARVPRIMVRHSGS